MQLYNKYGLRDIGHGLLIDHVTSELHKRTFINKILFSNCYWFVHLESVYHVFCVFVPLSNICSFLHCFSMSLFSNICRECLLHIK